MADPAVDASPSALLAVIQMLLSARALDDVRAAVARGAWLISRYDSLELREVQASGALEATLQDGQDLGAGARAVEELLCAKVRALGRTASTLDRFASSEEQSVANDFMRRYGLCLVRPLHAYGEFIGLLVLHFANRTALGDAEFDALRRFVDFAAVALSNARGRSELHSFAYTDPLTGLANRRRLDDDLASLRGSRLSLLLIDFDGLKAVNETLDYDRGDELIAAVGVRLAAAATPDEFVFRYGGDEFVVIMPDAESAAARTRAEEMTAALDQLELPEELARLFHGASIGWATAEPGEDPWEILRRAGAEMRSRKRRRKTDRDLRAHEADFPRSPGGD